MSGTVDGGAQMAVIFGTGLNPWLKARAKIGDVRREGEHVARPGHILRLRFVSIQHFDSAV
jgi:hypothetical protein